MNTYNPTEEDEQFLQDQKLNFKTVPFFLFFDADRNFIHYCTTKPDVSHLTNIGKTALHPGSRTSALATKYQNGDRTVKTLYAYAQLLDVKEDLELKKVVVNQLFESFPKEELGTEKSYIITKKVVDDVNNGFFQYWINNLDEVEGIDSSRKKGKEKKVLADIVLKSIYSPEGENWTLDQIMQAKEWIVRTELYQYPDAFFWQKESKIRYENKEYDTVNAILNQMITKDSENYNGQFYTLEYYMDLFKSKKEVENLMPYLSSLEKKLNPESLDEKLNMQYLWILYFDKIQKKKELEKSIALYHDLAENADITHDNQKQKIRMIENQIN